MKYAASLRSRVVFLVLVAVLPLFGLSLIGAMLAAKSDVSRATKNLEFSATLIAADQQRVADSVRQVLTAISHVPELVSGKEPICQNYFKTLAAELNIYTNIGVVGPDGFIRCHVGPNNPTMFVGDRPYFQSAMVSKDFVGANYLIGRLSAKPVLTFALPLKDNDGKVQTVAFAAMLLSEVAKTMASVTLPAGGHVLIMDRAGVVLATSSNKLATVGEPARDALVRDAIKARIPSVFEASDADGVQKIHAFRPSSPLPNPPFFVLITADKRQVLAPALEQLALNIFALLLITLVGAGLAWLLAGHAIVNPAGQILGVTHLIQAGALGARIPVRPNDPDNELTRIAIGFNSMADSIQQREAQQAKSYAELRQIQDRLIAAQKLGRMGHWEQDMVNNRLIWSDQLHDLFGLRPGDFDGENATFLKMIHPDDRARYEAQWPSADVGISDCEIEYRIVALTGQVRWMHQRGQLIRDEAGRPVSHSGVVLDITAQQESREHLHLLETAIANLNDVVVITSAEPVGEPGPCIVFVNDAFEKHTGYSREEALGRSPRFLQGPKTQQSELRRVSEALKAWQPSRSELINYTKSGEEFWIEMDIVPIANAKGWFTHWVSVQRDITQRKAAERALSDSEQRYAALFETAPVPMWVFDAADYRFIAVNRAAVENYGYSVDEFQSMTIFDIRDASDHTTLRHVLLRTAPPRESWQHRRKDGSFMTVNVVAKPIQYAGREACFVVAIDITAQANAEKDVQDQLFTLQRAADAAQAIIWHQTLDGMLDEAAEQARGVIGAHQGVITLTLDNDRSQAISTLSVSAKYAAFMDSRDLPDSSGIYALVCGTRRVVRMTQAELEAHPSWADLQNLGDKYPPMRGWLAVPLMGRDGQNIGLLQLSDKFEGEFTLQDEYIALELAHLASIAIENARLLDQVHQLNDGLEQKVAERTLALARQEALFRAVAEQAPQVIWTADNKGVTNYFNHAWFDLVGGSFGDGVGRKWSSVMHPEDLHEVRENWKRALATRSAFTGIRRIYGRDGSFHVMSYRALPVLDDHGEVSFWVGIDADITEIKRIESALRLSNQELEAFSYSVSHDLRAPLNTIEGFSRLLSKQLAGDVVGKSQHYLARIQSGVAQMGTLIEDLLSLSQVSRIQLRHEPIDLSALSKHVVEAWRVRQPERDVIVEVEPDLNAFGDVRLVRMVIENLLGNAWKFTSQKDQAHIAVGQTADAAGAPVFFVRDNGAGFDMAYSDKLFIAFQRLHATSEFPGSGVGLATVGRVIGRHGGQFWADAAPGKGATFFFTLPKMLSAPKYHGIESL